MSHPSKYLLLDRRLARVMYSIICCRIVLHLREAAHSPYYVESNLSWLFSALNFRSPPRLQRVAIPLAEDIEMTTTSRSVENFLLVQARCDLTTLPRYNDIVQLQVYPVWGPIDDV